MSLRIYRIRSFLFATGILTLFSLIPVNQPGAEVSEQAVLPSKEVVTLSSTDFPPLMQSAYEAYANNNYIRALRLIEREITGSKEESRQGYASQSALADLYFLKGLTLYKQDNCDGALPALKSSVHYGPSNSSAHYLIGICSQKTQHLFEALSAYEEALWFGKTTAFDTSDLYLRMAQIRISNAELDKADEALRAALKVEPSNLNARITLAEVLMQKDEGVAAVKLLRSSPEEVLVAPKTQLVLAKTLLFKVNRALDTEKIKEAKQITQAISNQLHSEPNPDPSLVSLVNSLYVRSLIEIGELKEADEKIRASLKLASSDPELLRLRDQLQVEKVAVAQRTEQPELRAEAAETSK